MLHLAEDLETDYMEHTRMESIKKQITFPTMYNLPMKSMCWQWNMEAMRSNSEVVSWIYDEARN